ncbi:hypothetical protein, partial [Hydrococcus rivularis]|uniref:hypothetical protein n=1 Tax=Hydrococcus rivularis TaxID=1616834 RepID=UPI001C317B83
TNVANLLAIVNPLAQKNFQMPEILLLCVRQPLASQSENLTPRRTERQKKAIAQNSTNGIVYRN